MTSDRDKQCVSVDLNTKKPKVSFKTFGCRLNQAETAEIASSFISAGYKIVPFGSSSNVCVIHTCSVTAKAESESLRTVRKIKSAYPSTTIVITGCTAEVVPAAKLHEMGADMVISQKDKYKIPLILANNKTASCAKKSLLPFFENTRALLKIQNGCNFFCSYCIVPYARGPACSLPYDEIMSKAKKMADNGFKEIVITGTNIGTYNYENKNLIHLLEGIEKIQGIERIRLSSIELSTIEYPLFHYFTSSKKLCKYIHIPLQSGDDEILKAMNRRYSSLDYRRAIEKIIEYIPNIGLGTDVIAGFPGESNKAFEATYNLISLLPFSNIHVFPFSLRQLTKASKLNDRVHPSVIKTRVKKLLALSQEKQREFAEKFIKKTVNVLIEKTNKKGSEGWSEEYVYIEIPDKNIKINNIVKAIPLRYEDSRLIADFKDYL